MGVRAQVVGALSEHVEPIAQNARAADFAELLAAGGVSPSEAMLMGLSTSTAARTGLIDGEPVCMFGISPASLLTGVGVPWMIGTDRLERYQFAFLRRCRGELMDMGQGYTWLVNWVDDRNTCAIRWLRWLGFTIHDPEPYGVALLPFRRFDMKLRD